MDRDREGKGNPSEGGRRRCCRAGAVPCHHQRTRAWSWHVRGVRDQLEPRRHPRSLVRERESLEGIGPKVDRRDRSARSYAGDRLRRPDPAHIERARHLLAHEAVAGSGDPGATTAPGRVYDKLHAHLSPIVGAAGVQLLFVRSAKLAQGEFAWSAEVSILDGSTKLRDALQAKDPAIATESAAVLFGTFFTLITTFIGERLTMQVLRAAWPTLEETARPPRESNQ